MAMEEIKQYALFLPLGGAFPCMFGSPRGIELTALTGMGDRNSPLEYPGRDTTARRVSD